MMSFQQKRLLRRLMQHHLFLAVAVAISFYFLYATRPSPDWVMKSSFATGYIVLVLLAITLWIGPWNLLRRRRMPISSDLRRDFGIWAGILGIAHTIIGLNVHFRGRLWLYFVYPNEGSHLIPLRHDLFGFANYTGLVATLLLVVVFATSNDYSLRMLGTPRWKQLQRWNYVLFGFAILHTAAYQIIEKQHLNFVAILVICTVITLALQGLGFQRRRSRTEKLNIVPEAKES